MQSTILPSYTELEQALSFSPTKLHPSQLHGMLCGILCGESDDQAWEKLITVEKVTVPIQQLLKNLLNASSKDLADFLFEFQLILPPDEAELAKRAEALTLWCQGFLTGLKLVDIPIEGREASEETEAIHDLIEIAKMNYEEVIANEEDEAAYVELIEYVRVAVILLYQDRHDEQEENAKESLW